jgi:hypothetical protein
MSPWTNCALSATPASRARPLDRVTISGLYSTPMARAPRLAAAMMLRPSPEPRSITKSCGVTFARSSIFSTSAAGVGTQTTSFPAWPSWGTNGFWPSAVCAAAEPAVSSAIAAATTTRVHLPYTVIGPPSSASSILRQPRRFPAWTVPVELLTLHIKSADQVRR